MSTGKIFDFKSGDANFIGELRGELLVEQHGFILEISYDT